MSASAVQTPLLRPEEMKAHVVYSAGKKKCPVISIVSIRIFDSLVATGTLGGKYTEQQALNEYRKNPRRFKPGPAAEMALLSQ